jgi:hypothetical protein
MKHRESTEADYELVKKLSGAYAGMLNEAEQESFRRCVADGLATTYYHSPAAQLLGLPKVRAL